jgi:hypothetical protein
VSLPSAAGSGARSARRAPAYRKRPGELGSGSIVWGWICWCSCSCSVVVIQQSAETLASFHFSALANEFWIRADELVVEALMVALTVVMRGERGRSATNRALTKQDQSFQARLFNRAHKTLRVRVQIRTSCRQFD